MLGGRPTRWTAVDRVGAGSRSSTTTRSPRCSRPSPRPSARRTPQSGTATAGCSPRWVSPAGRHGRAISRCGTAEPASAPCRRAPPRTGGRHRAGCAARRRRWRRTWPWCVRSQLLTGSSPASGPASRRPPSSERDRLRRDLHDGLGPSLSGIALSLQAASRALAGDPASVAPAARAHPRRVRGRGPGGPPRPGRAATRRPRPPRAAGGRARHRHVAGSRSSRGNGVRARRRPPARRWHRGSRRPPYRIVAESLTNVARHARAGRCTVRLAQADGHLRVAITDDGCGAQPAPGGATGTASSRCAVARPTSAESSASRGPPSRDHRDRDAPPGRCPVTVRVVRGGRPPDVPLRPDRGAEPGRDDRRGGRGRQRPGAAGRGGGARARRRGHGPDDARPGRRDRHPAAAGRCVRTCPSWC